jgi:hypothetical protein
VLKALPDQSDPAVVDNFAGAYALMADYAGSVDTLGQEWNAIWEHGSMVAQAAITNSFCKVLYRLGRHDEAASAGTPASSWRGLSTYHTHCRST